MNETYKSVISERDLVPDLDRLKIFSIIDFMIIELK